MHCLYLDGAGINTLLGCVVGMFHGKDDMMDDFVLFQLKRLPITTRMGHYCWFSGATQNTDLVVWTEIYWKCKVLKGRGGGRHGAAVCFVQVPGTDGVPAGQLVKNMYIQCTINV